MSSRVPSGPGVGEWDASASAIHALHVVGRDLGAAVRASGADTSRAVVLAIPRGGVLVADQVARMLGALLDVWAVATVSPAAPSSPIIGAVAAGGYRLWETDALATAGITAAEADEAFAAVAARVDATTRRVRATWPLPELESRTAVVVDDLAMSGVTAACAIAAVRQRGAADVVVAIGHATGRAAARLRRVVDRVVIAHEVTDTEVIRRHGVELCPPIGDDEIRALIVREHRDLGLSPFGYLAVDR